MRLYTAVLRQSNQYWLALCLENGIVSQGNSQDEALSNLKEAIDSVQEIEAAEPDMYRSPVAIQELHEFLTLETAQPALERYEFRALSA